MWWDSAVGYASPLVQAGDAAVVSTPGGLTGIGTGWEVPGWRTARGGGQDPWIADSVTDTIAGAAGVGAAGELSISGVEWLGARAYDSSTHGFLSVDPVEPVVGAGWAGNPYAYAGNDPLHAVDPSGLSPVTDAELAEYAAANTGVLENVGDWAAGNWEYLAGGAMIIGGGALMVVGGPVGMVAGGALIGAGADTIMQKAATGGVDWGQVAVSGAAGALGGGADALAMRAGATGMRVAVAEGVVDGAVSGAGSYAVSSGPHTPGGFLAATGRGIATGGAGGAATNRLLPVSTPRLGDRQPTPTPPPRFPHQLTAGGRNADTGIHVYQGVDPSGQPVYVGITNDLLRRQRGHGTRFRIDEMVEGTTLTWGQARAVEQAVILRNPEFRNLRNEISPKHPYYADAVAWGEWWLTKNGF